MATMALRHSALHVLAIGVSVYLGAREIYSHDFSNSTDVFRGPVESPVALRDTTILPSIESLDESTSITSTPYDSDTPTFTTTEYITIIRTPEPEDRGLSTVRPIYGGQNGRNPYANNPLVQSLMHTVAPLFGNPTFMAVHGVLESIWSHPFTQVIVDAFKFVLGFFLYLWMLLPEPVRGLMELSFFTLSFYATVSHTVNDYLRRWLNPNTPDDPAASPSPPSSGGPPGGGGGNPPSDDSKPVDAPNGPKPPTNTASVGTQTDDNTTPAGSQANDNTTTSGTQTYDNNRSIGTQTIETRSTVTARERNCQNNLQRVQSELAEAILNIEANEQTIVRQDGAMKDLRENLTDLRRNVQLLTSRNEEAEKQVSDMTVAERKMRVDLAFYQVQAQRLEGQVREATRTHSSEINRLQAERDATPTDLGYAIASHQEEIKRLNEAHEAQINELASTHDATVQELRSEVEKLNDTLRKVEDPDHAEERHSREIKDAVDRERANASKELQDTTTQYQERISDLENQLEEERKQRERSATLAASPLEAESAELIDLREEIQRLESLLASKDSEESAAKEQKKLSDEAQEGQTKALADCNDRVKALENTNTELTQQNKTLLEKEREARDAENKARSAADQARTEIESLHGQVESLSASLSARDGNDAAIDAAQRAKDNDEQLNRQIQQLQQELIKARESAEIDTEQIGILETEFAMMQEERDNYKQKTEALLIEGNDLLGKFNDLSDRFKNLSQTYDQLRYAYAQQEEDYAQQGRNSLAEITSLREAGLGVERKLKLSEDANNRLQQTLREQHQKCQEEKDRLQRQSQALLTHEKGNNNTLRAQNSELQGQNQELQHETAGLRSENDMLRNTNTSLIQTNNGLADQDLKDGLTNALQAQAQNGQVDNANQAPQSDAFTNQAPQSNPFSNPPPMFPSQAGTASGGASPTTRNSKRGSEASDTADKHPNTKPSNALGRKIAPHRSRANSPVKRNGESEDPAQDILDWCN
ncbi:hypothetical protein M436DRAFT_83192 [Aureobasidium namibiae CBS 147.97]|uniref:Uncharacterized protein n=1 Tax=Aureobasidium namibiae CBS 147.97 TaxID=1043004 RepID=A0A074WEX5_9PEZI